MYKNEPPIGTVKKHLNHVLIKWKQEDYHIYSISMVMYFLVARDHGRASRENRERNN